MLARCPRRSRQAFHALVEGEQLVPQESDVLGGQTACSFQGDGHVGESGGDVVGNRAGGVGHVCAKKRMSEPCKGGTSRD